MVMATLNYTVCAMTSVYAGVTVEIGIPGEFRSKRIIARTTIFKRAINDLVYTKIYLR